MLATIRLDVPISFKIPEKKWREGLDIKVLLNLFTDLNFRTLSRRVEALFGVPRSEETSHDEKQEAISEEEEKRLALMMWIVNSDITNPTREDILQFTKKETLKEAQKYLAVE